MLQYSIEELQRLKVRMKSILKRPNTMPGRSSSFVPVLRFRMPWMPLKRQKQQRDEQNSSFNRGELR
jgi:hypothetical protein